MFSQSKNIEIRSLYRSLKNEIILGIVRLGDRCSTTLHAYGGATPRTSLACTHGFGDFDGCSCDADTVGPAKQNGRAAGGEEKEEDKCTWRKHVERA